VHNRDAVEHIDALRIRINSEINKLVEPSEPTELYDALRYVLEGKGKRFRPILTLLAADIYGCEIENVISQGLAMEVFHNSTLVHDDIMDRSGIRRGRESVHVKWNDASAILVGDYLLGLSYRLLSEGSHARLSEMLALHQRTLRMLCEGQFSDMAFEARKHVSVEEYLSMIDRKTAALLQSSLQVGGLAGNADGEDLDRLREIGWHIGRAFQIQDDLLDLTAADSRWGKPIGNDLVTGKKTFLLLTALENSAGQDHAWFTAILDQGGLPEGDVSEATVKMENLGVLEAAKTSVIFHSDESLRIVSSLPQGQSRESLCYLIRQMQQRLH